MKNLLQNNKLILMEAAIIEQLRRSDNIHFHPSLVNAPLIYDDHGSRELTKIYESFIHIADSFSLPLLLCTPTWRANKDRVENSGIEKDMNGDAFRFLDRIRNDMSKVKIGGLLGCKNDCYLPEEGLSATEAEDFHAWQVEKLTCAGVDFLIAETLPNVEEALGISKAMQRTCLPYMIGFVINREGKVLDGTSIPRAIERIDAATDVNPIGYMVSCAYPTFLNASTQPSSLFSRLIGFLGNGSSLDHCELEGSTELKSEKVSDWGDEMFALHRDYGMSILGGCCGTSKEHLKYIAEKYKAEYDSGCDG